MSGRTCIGILAPLRGLLHLSCVDPRLAPWAMILRRFAAEAWVVECAVPTMVSGAMTVCGCRVSIESLLFLSRRSSMKSQRLIVWCVLIFVLALGVGAVAQPYNEAQFKGMQWRSVGPYRGGRVLAVTGGGGGPFNYYFGGVGGGGWGATDGGVRWQAISVKNGICLVGGV